MIEHVEAIGYEIIDAGELAKRWKVPQTWVYEYTRRRNGDHLPHVRLGRYRRFEWGSPALMEWWARHRVPSKRGGESKNRR